MKRFLFPLLAALALPTAVNAKTWWMIGVHWIPYAPAGISQGTFTVPFSSEEACEAAGLKLIASDRFSPKGQKVGFECVENK